MTEILKCPFCGSELENACAQVIYFCPNDECHKAKDWYASKQVWQALIDGKKAQDALKGIKIRVAAIRGCVQDGYTQLGERNRNIFIALELFKDLTKEITSITKQDE